MYELFYNDFIKIIFMFGCSFVFMFVVEVVRMWNFIVVSRVVRVRRWSCFFLGCIKEGVY